ncbi:DUF3492 domain-containing protein, partial [Streptomyces specialis]|uniref:DUF3492 domain-containing protein n=1 Tax=Streptomyces specialis TaxID=498367 RepID=UPI00131B6FDF
MRVALLTEGGYPYAQGESVAWCDRLLHGLAGHDPGLRFDVHALSRSRQQAEGPRRPLPPAVRRVRTAPLWGPPVGTGPVPPALARRFADCFAELTAALVPGPQPPGDERSGAPGDRFARGLYGLAALAAEHGGLGAWLGSEQAVRILEAACLAPGAPRALRAARIADLLAVAGRLERALRPLSLDWRGARGGPGGGGGPPRGGGPPPPPGGLGPPLPRAPPPVPRGAPRHAARLPAGGLAPSAPGAAVRALLTAFQARLAREAYARAAFVTPGDTPVRRRAERCGAGRFRGAAGEGVPGLLWAGRA